MYVLAAPNGSGKSPYYARLLSRWVKLFVNADVIAERMSPGNPDAVAWEAAKLAEQERSDRLKSGDEFAAETMFSHPSKLDFIGEAKAAEYYVRVLCFCLESPSLNAMRVKARVAKGGHDVPTDKITGRYWRAIWRTSCGCSTTRCWARHRAGLRGLSAGN